MIQEKIETEQQNENTFFRQSNIEQIKKAVLMIRAMDHEERRNILNLLSKEMNVTQIRLEMKMEQSATSQHLAILRAAKLVKKRRLGKRSIYIRNEETIERVKILCEGLSEIYINGQNKF